MPAGRVGLTSVSSRTNVDLAASASFGWQASATVKVETDKNRKSITTKVEATMTTVKKLIAGITVWSVLLWRVR